MDQWKGTVAVVTGASTGIGKAIAVILGKQGLIVAVVARRKLLLDDIVREFEGEGRLVSFAADVSQESEVEETFKKIESQLGPIRVLVNNAGVALSTPTQDFDLDKWKKTFDVNFFGLMSCTKQVIMAHRRKDHGLVHIINVNSVAGHVMLDLPGLDIYSASKHCITLITRVLIKKTSRENIRFTSLSPGLVETDIFEAGFWPGIEELKRDNPTLAPEDIADAVVYLLSASPHVVISELTIKPKGEYNIV